MQWKELVYQQIIDFCNANGSRTFSIGDLFEASVSVFLSHYPNNKHPRQKLAEMLQQLRDDGLVSFLGNSGNYTLRGVDLLDVEKEELKAIDVSYEAPLRREYLIETYVRNVTWARKARETFGCYCMFDACKNSFLREDGTPYIEVHHIVPLFEGGEDSLPNLSVLCAHHHKMAHFSASRTVSEIQTMLLERTKSFLGTHLC